MFCSLDFHSAVDSRRHQSKGWCSIRLLVKLSLILTDLIIKIHNRFLERSVKVSGGQMHVIVVK